ncbi:hypothetical protein Tco_0929478 [Tanacetum coccineum]
MALPTFVILKKVEDLTPQEKLQYKSDIKAVNILLLRLPIDIYTLINHYQTAKEIWDRVKELMEGRQSQGYAGSARKNQATGARVVNIVGDAGTNQPMDKMLLAQVQEAGVVLNDEQQDFLADNHVDAYDSVFDDEATVNAISMANMSPVGSINDDTVEPRYDSDILSEVPHYDTYHESDMFNSNVQDMGYIENIVSNNASYDELTSNSNVISYADYMVTIGNNADNYVPPPVQKNDMILSVLEQMKSQVEKCNTVN